MRSRMPRVLGLLALAACSSPSFRGADAGMSHPIDGASPTGDTGSHDGAGQDGAGPVMPEGGRPSTPGMIECGGQICSAPVEFCCLRFSGSGCVTAGTTCVGAPIACKESGDCIDGQLCCGSTSVTNPSTFCATTCPLGSSQLCRTNAECAPSGTTCEPIACRSFNLETCGGTLPPVCN